MATAWF